MTSIATELRLVAMTFETTTHWRTTCSCDSLLLSQFTVKSYCAKCRFAECRYTKRRGAPVRLLPFKIPTVVVDEDSADDWNLIVEKLAKDGVVVNRG